MDWVLELSRRRSSFKHSQHSSNVREYVPGGFFRFLGFFFFLRMLGAGGLCVEAACGRYPPTDDRHPHVSPAGDVEPTPAVQSKTRPGRTHANRRHPSGQWTMCPRGYLAGSLSADTFGEHGVPGNAVLSRRRSSFKHSQHSSNVREYVPGGFLRMLDARGVR